MFTQNPVPSSMLIPMFPLSILPLPGELVPLHIFEPRYRELIREAEENDISFGIYFMSEVNNEKIGSLMTLESVIKRYPGGESDIVIKCLDIFRVDKLYRTFKNKMYPGGEVTFSQVDTIHFPASDLKSLYEEYLELRNIVQHFQLHNVYQIAAELHMDTTERYKFLVSSDDKKELLLQRKLKFLIYLLQQEAKSKDVFHLN